jgi:DsbC/DsbD-like thiol-disulfide interchange protein
MITSRTTTTLLTSAAIVLTIAGPLGAQSGRPRAEIAPVVETSPIRAGSPATIALHVRLPKEVHVQSNKPRDPSLIPTVLTLELPAGITVTSIEYPAASDLSQPGRKEPLAVYGNEFAITVRLSLAAGLRESEVAIPGVLRYQACNDSVCFPPARESTTWTLDVKPGG